MALADILSSMQQQFPSMDGITNALAQNALKPPPQAAPQAQPYRPHGIGNVLGQIGDALLQANGIAPIHQAYVERRQTQDALQNFLTDPQGAIANLMRVDAPTGIALWKAMHPPSEVPDTAKVYEYRQRLSPDQQVQFDKVNQLLHPGLMTPYSMPEQGGTIQTPGSSGPTPGQVVNGFRFKGGHPNDPSAWEPASGGGATASTPSPTFR